jgi:plastocyanin
MPRTQGTADQGSRDSASEGAATVKGIIRRSMRGLAEEIREDVYGTALDVRRELRQAARERRRLADERRDRFSRAARSETFRHGSARKSPDGVGAAPVVGEFEERFEQFFDWARELEPRLHECAAVIGQAVDRIRTILLRAPLPGEPGGPEDELTVTVRGFAFAPDSIDVPSGSTLTFDFQEAHHTVKTVSTTMGATAIAIDNGSGEFDAVSPIPQRRIVTITGMPGAQINYQCGIHGPTMNGKINITAPAG